MIGVAANHGRNSGFGEIFAQGRKLMEAVGTETVDAYGQGKLLAAPRLIPGKDGWSRFEEGIAA